MVQVAQLVPYINGACLCIFLCLVCTYLLYVYKDYICPPDVVFFFCLVLILGTIIFLVEVGGIPRALSRSARDRRITLLLGKAGKKCHDGG